MYSPGNVMGRVIIRHLEEQLAFRVFFYCKTSYIE